jgi:hypothetical protein
MVILFGYETYYVHGQRGSPSRLASYCGIGNTLLPKGSTLTYWCRMVVVYIFKFPLLMTGKYKRSGLRIFADHEIVGFAILVTFTWPIGEL